MQHSTGYIIGFAAVVCLVCAVFVSSAAVGLKDRQEANRLLDRQEKVLKVAGLVEETTHPSRDEIRSLYESSIQAKVIDLATGEPAPDIDPRSFDQRAASKDPEQSHPAPENPSKIMRLPNHALVFDVVQDGERKALIIPIEGYGLWEPCTATSRSRPMRARSSASPSTATRRRPVSEARSTTRAGRRSGPADWPSTTVAFRRSPSRRARRARRRRIPTTSTDCRGRR